MRVEKDFIGSALLLSMIGPENSRHSLNRSDAKLQPITTWSPAFSRALGRLVVFWYYGTRSKSTPLMLYTFVIRTTIAACIKLQFQSSPYLFRVFLTFNSLLPHVPTDFNLIIFDNSTHSCSTSGGPT